MKAASKLHLVAIALLAACAPAPRPTAVVVAPVPVEYTCEQQRQLSRELQVLPGTMIEQAMIDYGVERRKLRAVQGLPEPQSCQPGEE